MIFPKYNTIGARLVLAFACSTLLLTIVSIVAWGTWNSLDNQVSELLDKSVPKYNASYLLESSSSEIKRRIEIISNTRNKVELDEQRQRLDNDLTTISKILNEIELNSEQQRLLAGYQRLRNLSEQFGLLVGQRIDQSRQIELLQEQIQWLHQDIGSELTPLRQEIQWQLERKMKGNESDMLFASLGAVQSILDGEAQTFMFAKELIQSKHISQVNNGMKVLQYRLEELYAQSAPIFSQPATIAYQQLLSELMDVLSLNGSFHQNLRSMVRLNAQLDDIRAEVQQQLLHQHTDIAMLVANADESFVQAKKETTELVSHGNRILFVCFSLSIIISLFLTYYFINRRIVGRLNRLSDSLDAIIHNDLSHPIVVDGRDEIGRISEKLVQYGKKVEEMDRTNALSLINNTQASLITCDLDGYIESANLSARVRLNIDQNEDPKAFWLCFSTSTQSQLQALFNPEAKLIENGADVITLSLGDLDKPYYLRLYLRKYTHGLSDKVIITITDVTDQEHANRLLEERVRAKTHSLREKNHQLLAEIEQHHRTENHLKKTQSELVQAAKMAVVGQTMTSLAHELNQPLSAMSTYLYSVNLALEQKKTEQIRHSIDHIEHLTERMGKIINGLRHFSRKSSSDETLIPVLITDVIGQAMLLVETKAKRQQIVLQSHIHQPIQVIADQIGLEQVLINLLVNGCEAVVGCGHKKVDVILLSSTPTHHVVAVCDSGAGFAHDVVEKLFTPFTTTKEVGLGLGLNICRSLIGKIKGQIYLASTVSRGAMVVLELPYES